MAKKLASNLLQGVDEICDWLQITERQFRIFLSIGFPARKVQGRWYAHAENVDQWFRSILQPGKPL
ncbi:MAG: hypothetical protein C4519_19835 [Desulfobacteraceae bacterium]|nr:MAG: hypothetical protein C4519_19835 [Desulfobacteraceae bacterium]